MANQPINPVVKRLLVTSAQVERSLSIGTTAAAAVQQLMVAARSTDCPIKMAWESGQVATGPGSYWLIKPGEVYQQEVFRLTDRTLYFALATGFSNEVVQCHYWN